MLSFFGQIFKLFLGAVFFCILWGLFLLFVFIITFIIAHKVLDPNNIGVEPPKTQSYDCTMGC